MLDRYHLLGSLRAERLSIGPASLVLREVATPSGQLLFFILLGAALAYTFGNLSHHLVAQGISLHVDGTLILLVLALLIALGFEFINGFHDSANAVATVIYTNALRPQWAVAWSGLWNLLGVLFSSGAVAFGIVTLLLLDLLLNVDHSASLAMIFALLISAIVWNLGTWWLGLPVSSSHTLIGSIVGVSLAHGVLSGGPGLGGSASEQLIKVGYALLLSPLLGFLGAGLLWVSMRAFKRQRTLFSAPQGRTPPPPGIRGLLILTCTGVSFAHGSNDGQKGIGLIMLILAALMPLGFAVDRSFAPVQLKQLQEQAWNAEQNLHRLAPGESPVAPREVLREFSSGQPFNTDVLPALAAQLNTLSARLEGRSDLASLPDEQAMALHDEFYLSVESIRQLGRTENKVDAEAWESLQALRDSSLGALQFIPTWVKVAVAMALGLGTLVGWRRIVTTVGEGIGKQPLTYAQGASAQLTAMLTIGAADHFGLPVSTTQVLSSGVAGTMAASGAGLQRQTLRNMVLAWVLTLPAVIGLGAALYSAIRALSQGRILS